MTELSWIAVTTPAFFYTNRKGVTDPAVDQATLYPAIGDVTLQDNAAAAIQSFVSTEWGQATAP
jgi:hypothetical protein